MTEFLAAMSSVLYFFLFWSQRLSGDALLQVLFVDLALWGWRHLEVEAA